MLDIFLLKVLKPYIESAPEGIVSILLLDSYHCHVMASVVNEIYRTLEWKLNTSQAVAHTFASHSRYWHQQAIYKKHMRHQWEIWMISEGMVEWNNIPTNS